MEKSQKKQRSLFAPNDGRNLRLLTSFIFLVIGLEFLLGKKTIKLAENYSRSKTEKVISTGESFANGMEKSQKLEMCEMLK